MNQRVLMSVVKFDQSAQNLAGARYMASATVCLLVKTGSE